MVRIRLWRGGKRNRPHYRVVVVDSRARRDGRVIENVGHYDPLTTPSTVELKMDRIQEWLRKGAKMSDSVQSLVKKVGAPPAGEPTVIHRPEAPPAEPEA